MSHTDAFYSWKQRVQALYGELLPRHQSALAEYSFGMVMAQCCGLSKVTAYLAGVLVCGLHAVRQRLRELYQPADAQIGVARTEFDYTLCFGPLFRWAAGDHPDKRLVIALDPSCLTDRFRVLCVAVLYRGCGLPVAWAMQTADEKGSWNDIWIDLLGRLKTALGEGWTVLVLTDRGLESPELFGAITALGWHPLMRVKAAGKFRPTGWTREYRFDKFAAAVGRRWAGAGTAYPTGSKLPCTLLASWDEGHEEPWLILTDLPALDANPAWYAWRMWIEQGFRAVKRGQWQWQRTRMEDAQRAARLWAVIATATVWAVSVGGEGQPAELPKVHPKLSVLTAGLLILYKALLGVVRLPVGKIEHHPWPTREWPFDKLQESDLYT